MKKYLILIYVFILAISNNILAQETEGKATIKRIKNIFKKEYSYKKYDKYNGLIEYGTDDKTTVFRFDEELTVTQNSQDSIFNILFKNGILYPYLLGGGKVLIGNISFKSISACHFENLDYTNLSPTKRRFSLWVFTEGFMNPNLYVLELTNDSATKNTELNLFFKDSYLSFIKYAWTIL